MGDSSYVSAIFDPDSYQESEDSLVNACGITAVCNLYEDRCDTEELVTVLKEKDYPLYARIKENEDFIGGCFALRGIVNVLTEHLGLSALHFDCRYCSQKRWEGDSLPLPLGAKGLVALKFVDSVNSHWVSFDGLHTDDHSCLLTDNGSEMINRFDIQYHFSNFDGLGHRIVMWDDYMYNVINHTNSVKCQGRSNKVICEQCMRKDFCSEVSNVVLESDFVCELGTVSGCSVVNEQKRDIDV